MKTKGILSPKLKEKWVKALESGEYEQGRYSLISRSDIDGSHAYCCLGVLGVICGVSENILNKYTTLEHSDIKKQAPSIPNSFLGKDVDNNLTQYFYRKNDGVQHLQDNPSGRRWSFQEIADDIKQNF